MASLDRESQCKNPQLSRAFLPDARPINRDTFLHDLLRQVATSDYAVPVVDEDGMYLGAISKQTLLETLDRGG